MTKKHTANGSITVFLSMILLLIISLMMTTVEALRVYCMSVYTERAIYTALDSVLAEYYYPLFKEYHVFGLDGSYGSDNINEGIIEDKLYEYMEYTFEPSKNIYFGDYNLNIKNFNLFDIKTDNIEVKDYKTLMDYDGALFRNQAIDYTRYRLVGDGLETFLEKINVIKDSGLEDISDTKYIMEEKISVEEEVSIITKDLMELSSLLDGIVISSNGAKTSSNGYLQINNTFVKQICNSQATIRNPYPTNSWVSSSLKGKYIDPTSLINKSISYLDSLIENRQDMDLIESEEISSEEINSEEYTIEKTKKIEEINKREKELIKDFNKSIKSIENTVNNVYPLIQKAINVTDGISSKQSKLTKSINNYKSTLSSKENIINDDLYSSLWSDYQELEKYKTSNNSENSYDFNGMNSTLKKNKDVLFNIKQDINIKVTTNKNSWLSSKEKLNNLKSEFSKYSHKDLQIDYSKLTKKENTPDVFKEFNKVVGQGVMGLLLEDASVNSDKNIEDISNNSLPSYIHKNNIKLANINKMNNFNLENSFGIFHEMIDTFFKEFNALDVLKSSADTVGSAFLYQKYLLDHFGSYDTETKVEMPTSLEYEIEYILHGKKSDSENINSMVSNLLIFRTMMNTISLYTNAESNEEAAILANALVGFLGLPILVTITKTIILFIWGLAESLIDVSALLQGKEIPIYKSPKDIKLKLFELLLVSRQLIKEKTEEIQSVKSPLYLNYSEYLNILLFFKNRRSKVFRALDLIQVNLQNCYEDTFYINNCLFGIQVSVDFSMDQKFVTLPFVKNTLGLSKSKYLHSTVHEYSY